MKDLILVGVWELLPFFLILFGSLVIVTILGFWTTKFIEFLVRCWKTRWAPRLAPQRVLEQN